MNNRRRTILAVSATIIALIGPASTPAQTDLSPSSIFRNSRDSIVLIVGGDSNGQPTVQGSGFVIAQDRIVTNHHVVAGASTAAAVFSDGGTSEVEAVVADSPGSDLIVLVASTGQRQPVRLGDELSLQQGDPVYAIGAPQGLELTLTNGIVSAFRNLDNRFLIQSTAAIGHGSSGGPLFDRGGKVVGITSSLLSDTPGIYFSVGVGDLKRVLRTPQLVTLSFAAWAKGNADATPALAANAAPTPQPSDADQIEKLIQDKKFDQAAAALHVFSAQQPDTEVVHRLNGELDIKLGDVDSAIKELDLAVQKEPTDAIGHFYYAIALFQARRFGEALEHEQKSNGLAPTDSDPPVLAMLYYAVRDYEQAETFAGKAISSNPENGMALAVLAGVSYNQPSTHAKTWKQYAQQIAVVNPDSFWVHMSEGMDAYNQNLADNATRAFKAAEQDDFPDSAPYYFLASWYARSSQLGEANDQINAGLASVPNDPLLLDQGMFISLRAHDETQAGRRFTALDQLYPGTLLAVGAACLYYYGIGEPTTALPYCARQIDLAPNDHTAHSNYGWVALDANQFPLALQEFTQAYNIASPNLSKSTDVQVIDLLWGFAIADYFSGDKKNAHKLLETVRRSYPGAATVTGLQKLPLLWSETTMTRIDKILMDIPK
jgi:tetratricopeptide (TPR) repeat protein